MTRLGEPRPVNTRPPKLAGGLNFRDLGGYATKLAATNGSVDRYLEDELGLTRTMIERIRVNLPD
jgi:hypothetical protein